MMVMLEKILPELRIEEVEITHARISNEKVGIAYGDTGKADASFRWSRPIPLRMIAHNQTGEVY